MIVVMQGVDSRQGAQRPAAGDSWAAGAWRRVADDLCNIMLKGRSLRSSRRQWGAGRVIEEVGAGSRNPRHPGLADDTKPMFKVNVNALETAALWVVAPGTSPTRESADPPVQLEDGRALIEDRLELVAGVSWSVER
jgi:hypothetical protein